LKIYISQGNVGCSYGVVGYLIITLL